MENNFDKIFKDKLEHRKFEMKPEYWEGAEALIEADERSASWRRFFVWFGVAMMVGLVMFFVWKNNSSNELVENEKTSNTNLENGLVPAAEKNNVELEILKEENSDASVSNNLTELSKNKKEENTSVNVLLGENKKIDNSESKSKNNTRITDISNPFSNGFSKSIPSSQQINRIENIENSNQVENNNNTSTIILGESNNIITKSDEDEKEEVVLPILENNSTINSNKNKKTEEVAVQPIASNSTILLPFLEMFLANNEKVKELDLKTVSHFTPSRDKFAFGIYGAAVGYPLVENSSETPFIGFKTGFLMERNFEIGQAKLALGAELTYHYRSGNFVATKQNDIAKYSFGRSIAQAKLTPENLHYLEIPLYLKYQKKRMTFETGASFNYLLGVRGKVVEVDGTTQSGWVPSLGFKNNHVNVLLGFHYRISDNLHFGVRANYTPGGILDSNAALPEGITVALQESKPLYLTVRVTQYLKFKK